LPFLDLVPPPPSLVLLVPPLQAFQLGPTEKSRYFVYYMPAQFVVSIKETFAMQKLL
jgi:hypothetical protein